MHIFGFFWLRPYQLFLLSHSKCAVEKFLPKGNREFIDEGGCEEKGDCTSDEQEKIGILCCVAKDEA